MERLFPVIRVHEVHETLVGAAQIGQIDEVDDRRERREVRQRMLGRLYRAALDLLGQRSARAVWAEASLDPSTPAAAATAAAVIPPVPTSLTKFRRSTEAISALVFSSVILSPPLGCSSIGCCRCVFRPPPASGRRSRTVERRQRGSASPPRRCTARRARGAQCDAGEEDEKAKQCADEDDAACSNQLGVSLPRQPATDSACCRPVSRHMSPKQALDF